MVFVVNEVYKLGRQNFTSRGNKIYKPGGANLQAGGTLFRKQREKIYKEARKKITRRYEKFTSRGNKIYKKTEQNLQSDRQNLQTLKKKKSRGTKIYKPVGPWNMITPSGIKTNIIENCMWKEKITYKTNIGKEAYEREEEHGTRQ